MKILITGSHKLDVSRDYVFRTLDQFAEAHAKSPEDEYGNWMPMLALCHGGAKGVDQWADDWAVVNWCPLTVFKADWTTHGKAAGGIRNQQMLDLFKPDVVIAFPGPESRGTWDMVNRAKKAGMIVGESILIFNESSGT